MDSFTIAVVLALAIAVTIWCIAAFVSLSPGRQERRRAAKSDLEMDREKNRYSDRRRKSA